MVMSYIWTGLLFLSVFCACLTGSGSQLSAALPEGAAAGVKLAISIGGSICRWSGVGKLMEAVGVTAILSQWLRPLLYRVFPSSREDKILAGTISANICANFLGLGNAATPMGIRAARQLKLDNTATDELCRLIVLNTASIQLIPANVAAIRAQLGASAPFDILPAVWLTSIAAAGMGLLWAGIFERIWKP